MNINRPGDPQSTAHYLRAQDASESDAYAPVMPSIPETQGANVTRIVKTTSSILDNAAKHLEAAHRYKAMWLCEVLRGEHADMETYSVAEIERANAEAENWQTFKGEDGALTAYRKPS